MFLGIHSGSVGSKHFLLFCSNRCGFFCPSSPIFNRHFLFFFPFVLIGKGDSVFICFFVICNIQHIHIYSNPSPNKTKIYLKKKNYIIVWVRVVSVGAYTSHWNHCSIFFLFFYFFFFCVLYYIQSIFFVLLEASWLFLPIFQTLCSALQSTVPHLY